MCSSDLNVRAVDAHRAMIEVTQRHVVGRAVLRVVDMRACEKRGASILEFRRAGERQKVGQGGVGDTVLGVVEQKIIERDGKTVEPSGVFLEEVDDGAMADVEPVGIEGGERCLDGVGGHGRLTSWPIGMRQDRKSTRLNSSH